jgi:hypothetical protein
VVRGTLRCACCWGPWRRRRRRRLQREGLRTGCRAPWCSAGAVP